MAIHNRFKTYTMEQSIKALGVQIGLLTSAHVLDTVGDAVYNDIIAAEVPTLNTNYVGKKTVAPANITVAIDTVSTPNRATVNIPDQTWNNLDLAGGGTDAKFSFMILNTGDPATAIVVDVSPLKENGVEKTYTGNYATITVDLPSDWLTQR